ncbi:MAG: DUF4340 domain-containing protein [Bacteroidales bacterium]
MKKNKFILIILLVLIAGAIYLWSKNSMSSLETKSSAFAVRDTATIVKFFMANKDNENITIKRMDNGRGWEASSGNQSYKANNALIKNILKTCRSIRVLYPVAKSAQEKILRDLATKSTKVEVYTKDYLINIGNFKLFQREKKAKCFYVGDATMDSQGTFMLLENGNFPCITHIPSFRGYLSTRFDCDINNWREYSIFREDIKNIQKVKLTSQLFPDRNYTIENIDNKLSLKYQNKVYANAEIDTVMISNYLANFSDVRFESLLDDKLDKKFIDSVAQSTPIYKINITRKDGSSKEVNLFEKNHIELDDIKTVLKPSDFPRMYSINSDDNDFVLVQELSFEDILTPADRFLK